MSDKGTIVAGLGLFVVLVTFPVWYSAAGPTRDRDGDGKADYRPLPEKPQGAEACIESTEFMRASHMDLLVEWRDSVVRGDDYDYISKRDGQPWKRSLSKTCMGCHTNQQKFCGECHDYLAVAPDCWQCHVEPEKSAGGVVAPAAAPPGAGGHRDMAPSRRTAPPTHEGRM